MFTELSAVRALRGPSAVDRSTQQDVLAVH